MKINGSWEGGKDEDEWEVESMDIEEGMKERKTGKEEGRDRGKKC